MGRPVVCNTCCPSDDPPPTTDCGGAIAVAFIDENDAASRHGATFSEKIIKYIEAYPNRLLFVLDVEDGYTTVDYTAEFLASDRCFCLQQEAANGTAGVPAFIKRDSSSQGTPIPGVTPSDVLTIIKNILNNSSKSGPTQREILDNATQVSVFRDNSTSMYALQVEQAYQLFKTNLLSEPTPKVITASVINTREDFICPFVFEHCCENQAAADVIKLCGLPECTPATLRFAKHPSSTLVIDDPCNPTMTNNSETGCDNCPGVVSSDHTASYKAVAEDGNGGILTHIDIDYRLQYRDTSDGTFKNIYDLPNAKSNIEQSLDLLVKNWLSGSGGGSGSSQGIDRIEALSPISSPSIDGVQFGFDIALDGNGSTIVVSETYPDSSNAGGANFRKAKIFTYKRRIISSQMSSINHQGSTCLDTVEYELVNDFLTDATGSEPTSEAWRDPDTYVDLSDDGLTLVVGRPFAGSLSSVEHGHEKFLPLGEWSVYDWNDVDKEWSIRGSAQTLSDATGGDGTAIGYHVKISDDGNTVAVGTYAKFARFLNSAFANQLLYVYKYDGSSWNQRGPAITDQPNSEMPTPFPSRISVDANIDFIAIGSHSWSASTREELAAAGKHGGEGKAWVVQYNAGTDTWDQVGPTIDGEFGGFLEGWSTGQAVAISRDNDTSTKNVRLAVLDANKTTVYDYDIASNTWNQVGPSLSRHRYSSILESTKAYIPTDMNVPSLAFGEDRDNLIIADHLHSPAEFEYGGIRVYRRIGGVNGQLNDGWSLIGNHWQDESVEGLNFFGTDVHFSRRGVDYRDCEDEVKKLGLTIVHSAPFWGFGGGFRRGRVYPIVTNGVDTGSPDIDITCHPLISVLGDPPSSCDLFEDFPIGNGCTKRVFNREFRIMAASDTISSVFSNPFKLYQYFGTEGGRGPAPPGQTGEWIREWTSSTSVDRQPGSSSQLEVNDEIFSECLFTRTNDTSGPNAFQREHCQLNLCDISKMAFVGFNVPHNAPTHMESFFQFLAVSEPSYPVTNKGIIQFYGLHNNNSLSGRLEPFIPTLAMKEATWVYDDLNKWFQGNKGTINEGLRYAKLVTSNPLDGFFQLSPNKKFDFSDFVENTHFDEGMNDRGLYRSGKTRARVPNMFAIRYASIVPEQVTLHSDLALGYLSSAEYEQENGRDKNAGQFNGPLLSFPQITNERRIGLFPFLKNEAHRATVHNINRITVRGMGGSEVHVFSSIAEIAMDGDANTFAMHLIPPGPTDVDFLVVARVFKSRVLSKFQEKIESSDQYDRTGETGLAYIIAKIPLTQIVHGGDFIVRDSTPVRSLCLNNDGNVVAWAAGEKGVRAYEIRPRENTFFEDLPVGPDQSSQFSVRARHFVGLQNIVKKNMHLSVMKMDSTGDNIIISCTLGQVLTGNDNEKTGWAQVFSWDGDNYRAKGAKIEGTVLNGQFGIDCDIDSTGDSIVVSSREPNPDLLQNSSDQHGAIRCYNWNGSAWELIGEPIRGTSPSSNLGFHLSYANTYNIKRVVAYDGVTDTQGNLSMYRFEER